MCTWHPHELYVKEHDSRMIYDLIQKKLTSTSYVFHFQG